MFRIEKLKARDISDEASYRLSLQMHRSGYRNVPKFWFLLVLASAFAMAMGKSS